MPLRFPALIMLGALLSAAPALVAAQSAAFLQASQKFVAAKSAGKVDDALKCGEEAARAAKASGDERQVADLYRSLGDYAAQFGKHDIAILEYQRALDAAAGTLGSSHPDLVPLLTVWAELELADRHYEQAESLFIRILDIERKAYGDYHENVIATLARLKALYAAEHDDAAVARIAAQMQPPPAPSRGGLPVPAAKGRRYKQRGGFATVRVFYGTNRAVSGESKPALYYGKARGDLQYGYFDVTIPATHKEAELETQPRWVEYTFSATQSEMRAHYVLLDKIAPLSRDDFAQQLRAQIDGAPSKDVFVFVHGYNNTFEDAARRTAQLAYDLDFDGTPLLYSWPSQGNTLDYPIDEAAVQISGRKMADFLDTVVNHSGAKRIHLIAHSMGNRALIEALQTFLAKRAPENRKHIFSQLIFTAPDVDRDYFTDAVAGLSESAERTTLYASDNDYALRTSQFLHGAPRAGTAGDVIVKLAGLDSIDMSAVPADDLGHSYFAANAGAIFDIFRLLWRGEPPPQRCGMSNPKGAGMSVWLFDVNVCKGEDLLEAGVILKRFGTLARKQVLDNMATLTDPTQKQEWSQILKRVDGLLPTIAATGTSP
jgi:esterase/lipase superfamily enzyme